MFFVVGIVASPHQEIVKGLRYCVKVLENVRQHLRLDAGNGITDTDGYRHNTLDKIQGQCLLEGIDTRDRILLTTGCLSAEMLNKAAKMQVPVLVSRTSPTDLAVKMAKAWGITLIGYARGEQIHVYSGEERVKL